MVFKLGSHYFDFSFNFFIILNQTRIGLSLFDGAGLGYLKESDLDNYKFELIPTLPQLEVLERSFYSFYVFI